MNVQSTLLTVQTHPYMNVNSCALMPMVHISVNVAMVSAWIVMDVNVLILTSASQEITTVQVYLSVITLLVATSVFVLLGTSKTIA